MKKIAVFPGSFDPITTGHLELINRALPLFDEIVVAIGVNSKKQYLFPLKQRLEWLEEVFKDEPSVKIAHYEGLTVKFCQSINAGFMLRGLRNSSDFDYEKTISQLNTMIGDGLETVFLISSPLYSHVSSTIVREIIRAGGDASQFLPKEIKL
ncbi:MAG: pantetheine-phosphate adenylyltransferase [Saprospiraceae bacterium]